MSDRNITFVDPGSKKLADLAQDVRQLKMQAGRDFVLKAGDTMTGALGILTPIQAGYGLTSTHIKAVSSSGQFPAALFVSPSTHATSRRTGITLDNWEVGQDARGVGTKDFYVGNPDGTLRLYISVAGVVGRDGGDDKWFHYGTRKLGTAQVLNSSNVTPSDVTGLSFFLSANITYHFMFALTYQTAAITTGIGFTFTSPAVTRCNWTAKMQQAAAGTDAFFEDASTTITTVIVSTAVLAANTNYRAIVEGYITPSADGTLQLRARSEVNLSQVTVQTGGVGILTRVE